MQWKRPLTPIIFFQPIIQFLLLTQKTMKYVEKELARRRSPEGALALWPKGPRPTDKEICR